MQRLIKSTSNAQKSKRNSSLPQTLVTLLIHNIKSRVLQMHRKWSVSFTNSEFSYCINAQQLIKGTSNAKKTQSIFVFKSQQQLYLIACLV